MDAPTIVLIVITVLGWATTAGIAWQKLSSVEGLLTELNGRVDKLELWKARIEGKKEGIAQEKNRRMEGEPNRKLQG